MKLEATRAGVEVYRHPRLPGGPRVWTILVRIGRKKQLFEEQKAQEGQQRA